MSKGPAYLDQVKKELNAGRNQWRRADNIFRAFGYVRRRQTAVDLIHKEVDARGLRVAPALSTTIPLSSYVRFLLKEAAPVHANIKGVTATPTAEGHAGVVVAEAVEPPPEVTEQEEAPSSDAANPADRALIVGNLEAAERAPQTIQPEASLAEALTLMDLRDFSQLVVATTAKGVKGVVSYKSIARAQLHGTPKLVKDALDDTVPRIEAQTPLLDVIAMFKQHDVVLVMGADKSVKGIVTPADIADEFSAMAGPFLLIGQIEEQLRWLVKDKVDLQAALKVAPVEGDGGPPGPLGIADLTMGELQWILSAPENWAAVGIKYDRVTFCKEFDAIRDLRNAVMHFRDLPGPVEFKRIQDFAAVVQRAYIALATA